MKIRINRYMPLALSGALLLAAGCIDDEYAPAESNALVAYIADGNLETRASFADSDGKFCWDAGDRIVVPYAGNRYETYEIRPDADPAKGTVLASTVGSNFREFYAVYPVSAWVAPTASSPALRVKLDAAYDISADVAAGRTDHAAVPMIAVNDPAASTLLFHHVGGLLRIICRDLDPATKTVAVRFDKDVTGTFTVNVDDPAGPFIACSGNQTGKNQVTFTVASTDAGIGSSVQTLILNVPVPCGTYGSLQVEALNSAGASLFVRNYEGGELSFARHHGKRLAFAEKAEEYVMGDDGSQLSDVVTDADGGLAVLAEGSFTSYGISENGDTFPIPFAMEYAESASGPWTREAPEWLTPGASINFSGGELPQRIEVAVAPLPNLIPTNRNGIPLDERTCRLRDNTPKTNFDLSTVNVATGNTVSTTTANCYVVQAPGTYRFPAVYGNAVKGGAVNEAGFHVEGRDADEVYNDLPACVLLGYYKDHLDQDIRYPYIADQLAHKSPSLTISKAQLLWMDAPGLIRNVQYGSGYVSFTVEKEDICQGNAVIAVFDNQGRIAWSWHIWVTDEDLTVRKAGGVEGKFLSNTNLGHCNKREMERYADRSCFIRIVQDIPDGKASNVVQIKSTAGPAVIRYANSVYYNWGRKDPSPGMDGNVEAPSDKPCYPTRAEGNAYYPVFGSTETLSLGQSIQNPHWQQSPDNSVVWSTISYANCWTSTIEYSTNDAVNPVKTVYDPCPVGFMVPNETTIKNLFTDANRLPPFVWQELSENGETMGIIRESDGLFLPALGYRGQALENIGHGGYYESSNGYFERAWNLFVWDRTRFSRNEVASCGSSTNVALMVRPMFE